MRWWETEEPPQRVHTVKGPFRPGAAHASAILLRPVEAHDIPALAALRAQEWESEEYWQKRIRGYLDGSHNPQEALPERALFVAEEKGKVVGFVAGHRTRRHSCAGELEWIHVATPHRGHGLARLLLLRMVTWFVEQKAFRVCVNVRAENAPAVALYRRVGAQPLCSGWMVWDDIRNVVSGG